MEVTNDKSTQSPSGLLPIRRTITTHDPSTGRAIAKQTEELQWEPSKSGGSFFALAYTTSQFPVNLEKDIDLETHVKIAASGKLGLANCNGTVCRFVDFAPNRQAIMHRTRSLDYGVVLQGRIEMVLDSEEVCQLEPGEVVVQRATSHGWRNPSATEWCRMVFVLQDCVPDSRYWEEHDTDPSWDTNDDGIGEGKDRARRKS